MGGVFEKKWIFLLGGPFNGFACFRTHLFAFGGPGGVDSAFSANCSLGLLWLRDSFQFGIMVWQVIPERPSVRPCEAAGYHGIMVWQVSSAVFSMFR